MRDLKQRLHTFREVEDQYGDMLINCRTCLSVDLLFGPLSCT
jgi:hypothetical protein